MLIHSCLPSEVRFSLEGMRHQFNWQHFLIFSWLVFLQILSYGPGNLMELQRMTNAISYFQMTRFLKAQGHHPNLWLWWMARQVISHLPLPEDGILFITADCTRKSKRSKRNPAMTKGKDRSRGPWILGLHILVICYHWHTYRIPVAFALVRHKSDPKYVKPNQLLQNLLSTLEIPQWVKQVVVLADAGFASKANFSYFQKRNWGYVLRLPRSWKLADGRKLSEIIKETKDFKRLWLPSINGKQRKTYHYHFLPCKLSHLGHVNLVIAKKRHKDGPKAIRILVTNVSVTAKTVLAWYQRRWYIEVLFKELKGTVALGEHQVNTRVEQVENSIGVSLAAYLLLLRLNLDKIPVSGSWSAFQLKRATWLDFSQKSFRRSIEKEVRKQVAIRLSA